MESSNINDDIDIRQYWLVLKRQWKPALATFSAVSLAALAFALSRTPVYEAESKLLFRSDRSTSLTGLGEALGRLEPLTFQANPLDTQVEIIQSTPILQAVIDDLNLEDDDGQPLKPSDLASSLTVRAIPGTDVLSIAYQSNDPEMAALVPNKIAEVFLDENVQNNQAEAIAAREFLSQQLPRTEASVNQAEINLQQFKERNQVVSLDQEASSLVDISFDLQRQIDAASSQITAIDSTLAIYQDRLNIQSPQLGLVLAALNQSEGVQQVLTDLQKIEEEIAVSSALFTSDSQTISRLSNKRDNLRGILNQRIDRVINDRQFSANANLQLGDLQTNLIGEVVALDAQRQGLIDQIATLSSQLNEYSNRMLTMPTLEKQLSELERELMIAQTTYQTLLSRYQELQVTEGQTVGNARLISLALIPEDATSSNKKLILAAGLISGSLLGIALAFILDLLDESIKSVKQVKDIFNSPVLGVIPSQENTRPLHLPSQRDSQDHNSKVKGVLFSYPVDEEFQLLQSNLSLIKSTKRIKSIAITSSIPEEGKSEITAKLAMALTSAGHKVVLVDANLRNPEQHRIWGLKDSGGLSEIVLNRTRYKETAQNVAPNLDIIPAGVYLSNPMSILESTFLEKLTQELEEAYDFVIFDTPSLLGNADACLLSKYVHGMLIVVRLGFTSYGIARSTKDFLNQSNQSVLGVVVSGVINLRDDPDSRLHYSSYVLPNEKTPRVRKLVI